jgi:ribosomal protein S18 acetylase RimI-like enzyme
MWKLYVHPDHHGRGIGSRLLAEVESMVEGEELWLEVVDGNHQAYDFYVSRGFREVERVTDLEWPDDVWLRKALGARPR